MRTRDRCALGAPEVVDRRGEARARRAVLLRRSELAPMVVLALTTVAAVTGAVLALLPAAVRRRPAGRLAPRRGDDGLGSIGPASEPLAP